MSVIPPTPTQVLLFLLLSKGCRAVGAAFSTTVKNYSSWHVLFSAVPFRAEGFLYSSESTFLSVQQPLVACRGHWDSGRIKGKHTCISERNIQPTLCAPRSPSCRGSFILLSILLFKLDVCAGERPQSWVAAVVLCTFAVLVINAHTKKENRSYCAARVFQRRQLNGGTWENQSCQVNGVIYFAPRAWALQARHL